MRELDQKKGTTILELEEQMTQDKSLDEKVRKECV